MTDTSIYRDIEKRTGGDIYIGVVGPVRTGKSTFIKRFMDLMVLPKIGNEYARERVIDELPQSGAGRTVMTTQPKFVPNEAVELDIGDDNITVRVRMVDCVGYMVPGALGNTEDEQPRMVRTPWFDYDIPFDEAAELGTKKVITEHSTIGIVVLTDGSITGISRSDYESAEERVIREMNAAGKPYIVLLNSLDPNSESCTELAKSLAAKYEVPVTPVDAMNMSEETVHALLEGILREFPLRMLALDIPSWIKALGCDHSMLADILDRVRKLMPRLNKMRDAALIPEDLSDIPDFKKINRIKYDLGSGTAVFTLEPNDDVFYRIISEECDYPIKDEVELIRSLKDFVKAKKEYDRVSSAIMAAEETGYGVVPPEIDAMQLDEPEIVQHGSRFGVRLRAHASGLHVVRVDIESEVNPLVGTAEQGEELVRALMDKFEKNPDDIWTTNIFGKSLYDLVKDGMNGKVANLPADVQMKLQNTINRMVNEGCNSLICLLL